MNTNDMLRYMQRESARVSWEARQENDAIGWKERAGLNEYCWHCCEGLKGLQLAAADWHAAIEATRDGRFDSLDPFHQRAHKTGCAEFVASEKLAQVHEFHAWLEDKVKHWDRQVDKARVNEQWPLQLEGASAARGEYKAIAYKLSKILGVTP